MPARKGITRRRVVAGAAAALAAMRYPAEARPLMLLGGAPATAGGAPAAGRSLTFVNTSGSTSPTDVPLQGTMSFRRGDVPSGSIAVPQLGGVDAVYQADNRAYWGDGSLALAVFRIARSSTMAAGGTAQYTFDVRPGSYDNTSAITTADITSASDFKVSISDCHTARTNLFTAGSLVAVTIDNTTGQINGGKAIFLDTGTLGTSAIADGGGSGGQISASGSTLTVVSPGSGYTFVGSGAFAAEFNTIVSDIASGGNHAGGRRIEQYAKGPVCDAWRASTTISGMAHAHVTFYVERRKKADGSFLSFRACAVIGTGLVGTTDVLPNYTYDLDWKNGATVIRGASTAYEPFTTIPHFATSAAATLDNQALMDWTVNDMAYKAIVPHRTPTEAAYLKETGIILPYLPIVSTMTVPTTPSDIDYGGSGGTNFLGNYRPMGTVGIRCPIGGAGSGNQENPMTEVDGLYYLACRNGLTAEALVWRRNSRVAAANSYSFGQLGGGLYEEETLYVPNVIPNAVQSFSGMAPTREGISAHPSFLITSTAGCVHPLFGGGTLSSVFSVVSDTYHQVCCTYGAYIIEGEQWQLDALMQSAATPVFGRNPVSSRHITVGATTYYGCLGNVVNNVRNNAWILRSAGYAAFCMPTTWADGSTNVERSYLYYIVKNNYDYLVNMISFTGTVKFGTSGATLTKSTDFTGSGWWPENFTTNGIGCEMAVQFMERYQLQWMAHGCHLFKDTTIHTPMVTFRDHMKISQVKLWDHGPSHYLASAYRIMGLDGQPPSDPVDPDWSGFDPANPTIAIMPQGGTAPDSIVRMTFTSGSATVTLSDAGGVMFYAAGNGNTRIADGSRIRLTASSIANATAGGTPPPAGTDPDIYYYWKELTASTGQLCTDAALTIPVVPTASASLVYFWLVPANAQPADNSGKGLYNGGNGAGPYTREAEILGTFRICKGFDMPDDANGNITNAIANAAAVFNSIPGNSFAPGPQYAFDSSRV